MATASAQRIQSAGVQASALLVAVDDLTGGLDLRRSTTLLQSARARRLRNVSLEEPGAWRPYPGWRTHSTTSLGNLRPQGAARIYLAAGAPFTLAAYNGSVYQPSDAGVWGAAVSTGWSTATEIFFPHNRELVAIFDGVNAPKKSADGTTWTQDGITAPAVPTLAAVAGGSLVASDEYEVAYSYVDTGLTYESNYGTTARVTPSGADLTIRVTVAASADPQVDSIYVYARDVTAGESVLRRVTTTTNTNHTVDITSNTWFPNGIEGLTDHNVPVAMRFGIVWRNRWWGVDATVGNRIRFSQVFQSQAWPGLYYIDIPFERGESIAALVALGDTLAVFGTGGRVYLIIGQTSLDFEVRPSAGSVEGAFGPRAACIVEQGIVHVAAGGVYIFDGATDRLLSQDLDPGWRDLVAGATVADLERIAVVYHTPRKEVRVAVPRLYPDSTPGEYVLDLSRTRLEQEPAWTATTRAIGGYVPWDGEEATAGNRGRLFSWKAGTGELAEEATGLSADGADLVAEYWGPSLVPAPRKVARFVEFAVEYLGASGQLGGEVWVDEHLVASFTVPTATDTALWGGGVWGTFKWGSRRRRYKAFVLPLSAEGRSVSVRVKYQGQGLPKVYTYGVALRAEPALRGI